MPSPTKATGKSKEYIGWIEIHQAVLQLTRQMLDEKYHPKYIVGVARGGAIPAVMLSHCFGATPIEFCHASSYEFKQTIPTHKRQLAFSFAKVLDDGFYDNPEVLFVDDLSDSGQTMQHIKMLHPKATLATLFYKAEGPMDIPLIDYPGIYKRKLEWLVFPWEVNN